MRMKCKKPLYVIITYDESESHSSALISTQVCFWTFQLQLLCMSSDPVHGHTCLEWILVMRRQSFWTNNDQHHRRRLKSFLCYISVYFCMSTQGNHSSFHWAKNIDIRAQSMLVWGRQGRPKKDAGVCFFWSVKGKKHVFWCSFVVHVENLKR